MCGQVRVWVPAAVMRRAQALMVQGTGPASSGLTVVLRSDFYESTVPLQVRACSLPPSLRSSWMILIILYRARCTLLALEVFICLAWDLFVLGSLSGSLTGPPTC